MDIPNERSSHTRPTPRGGGLIIVLVSLSAYAIYTNLHAQNFSAAYFCGAIIIASISWFDDLYSISTLWRFVVHLIAALIVVVFLGEFQSLNIPFWGAIKFGFYGKILTVLWIVWLTNAYNFMDGIDGLAGSQALTAGVGWLIAGSILGLETVGFYGGVIAFSSLGFLIHNWHPAKIFMGDVGSAFLGYTFAVIPLLSRTENWEIGSDLWIVAILLVWLFIFDTILTITRRIFKREKIWTAHRQHIYQRFVEMGLSQVKVTVLYVLISLTIVSLIIINLKVNDFRMWTLVIISSESIGLYIFSKVKEKEFQTRSES